ncbi:MAG: EF-hand domain-containing protein [Phycisphaerae bacterium]|nr:EF-hand domain-containing protein [Phycisphaerae bacterium]
MGQVHPDQPRVLPEEGLIAPRGFTSGTFGNLNDFNALNNCADLNGDGAVDFNDFLEFLNIYNVGC